jgi:hypothetical protein
MNAKLMIGAVGMYLLAATMAAANARPSWFEARTSGVRTLTLGGSAEFGPVGEPAAPGAFVVTLGAESASGAVVLTRTGGTRPEPGTYALSGDPAADMQALVVTGSPNRPTGVFRARGGQVTITRSGPGRIEGHFDIDAVGFEAATPADEDRELAVSGAFTASPSR